METIAPNPLCSELARYSEFLSHGWLAAMECRVEAGNLRHVRGDSTERTDSGDVMRLVEGGERYQSFEICHDLAVDQHGF
jgi:hypothetical protein